MTSNLVAINDLPEFARIIDSREDTPPELKNTMMNTNQMIKLLDQSGLQFILVNENPITLKLLDYGKYRFSQLKKEKEQSKKQREHIKKTKEFYLTPGMTNHDLEIRIKHIREALDDCIIKIGVKLNSKTRMQLPRNTNYESLVTDNNFILNKVLEILKEEIKPTIVNYGDNQISAIISKV